MTDTQFRKFYLQVMALETLPTAARIDACNDAAHGREVDPHFPALKAIEMEILAGDHPDGGDTTNAHVEGDDLSQH